MKEEEGNFGGLFDTLVPRLLRTDYYILFEPPPTTLTTTTKKKKESLELFIFWLEHTDM